MREQGREDEKMVGTKIWGLRMRKSKIGNEDDEKFKGVKLSPHSGKDYRICYQDRCKSRRKFLSNDCLRV